MIQRHDLNIRLNKFFQKVILKKQYIKALKSKSHLFYGIKERNYRNLRWFVQSKNLISRNILVVYIIYIFFTRGNIWLHIMDPLGESKFFCSGGTLFFHKGKKKAKVQVFKSIIHFLLKKIKFLFHKPVALHLKNVKSRKFWVLKKFRKKFSIKIVKSFNSYAYNGCRKKKVRRKKLKK